MLAGLEGRLWQDIEQIRGGDNWLLKLDDSLRTSAAYLILVGPGGIHKWVKFELYAAVRRHYDADERFPIFPVLLPGAAPESLPLVPERLPGRETASATRTERLPAPGRAADRTARDGTVRGGTRIWRRFRPISLAGPGCVRREHGALLLWPLGRNAGGAAETRRCQRRGVPPLAAGGRAERRRQILAGAGRADPCHRAGMVR